VSNSLLWGYTEERHQEVSAQDTDRHIIRLLQIQAGYSRKVERLAALGIDVIHAFDDMETALHYLALDMLGVPADNT
jgi:hypothetical protein